MTDDRHTFSSPRPVFGLTEPTWEIDVFRDGVDHPIETLRIDARRLPPRYGKKKKVVWQLPDDVQQIPKFAMDEKRRLLDLFKQQKKSRKKARRPSGVNPEEDDEDDADPESPKAVVTQRGLPEDAFKEKNEKIEMEDPRAPRPPFEGAPPGLVTTLTMEVMDAGPPSAISSTATLNITSTRPEGALPPPGFSLSQLKLEETCKYLSLSSVENIPVELAKLFMDTYYPSLTHNEELLPFYCNDAQKSLSVGTAHAFCASKEEISVQLASLSGGSQWEVRGVVAQQGLAGSVVLLLTGVVLTKTAPLPFNFSHAISLIRVSEGQYQIHNDALVLMTE